MATLSAAELESWRIAEAKTVQAPYLWLATGVALIAVIIFFARFPPLMGFVADAINDTQLSLFVPMAGFLAVVHYGAWGWRNLPAHSD